MPKSVTRDAELDGYLRLLSQGGPVKARPILQNIFHDWLTAYYRQELVNDDPLIMPSQKLLRCKEYGALPAGRIFISENIVERARLQTIDD